MNASVPPRRSARILVIEDNAANMELMTYLLTAFGHTPICASDGEQGVLMAREQAPDLVLCDVHLPRLDGYGVAAALRADPATARVPLVAVTAQAMVGDRERLLAAGFSGYVAKPIEPEQFVAQILAFFKPRATLLVVDDDPFMRAMYQDLFDSLGMAIASASSACEGMAMLAADPIEVILCDQVMPVTSGVAFLERARQVAPHAYRLMVTAAEPTEAVRLALARGDIDHLMAKPFDGLALQAAVSTGRAACRARRDAASGPGSL